MTHHSETIEIRGIHYHVEISGTGPPLVLLHGFTGSTGNWEAIRPELERRFTTVTVDLLGHGLTDSPADPQRYAMEQAGADLHSLVHQLYPETAVHLLGYSMGGRLALYTALTYPDLMQTLTLESASPGLKTEAERSTRRAHDDQLAAKIEADGLAAFVDDWTNQPLFATQPQAVRDNLRAQRLRNNTVGLANSLRGLGTGSQPSLWERLHELSCPTQMITGALDVKFAAIAQEMATQIPNAQLAIVPDAGHTVHVERPALYAQLVLDFLLTYT